MKRSIILVLDSFGIGATEDAADFGDVGSNTLGHIAAACALARPTTASAAGPLHLPNLTKLVWAKRVKSLPASFLRAWMPTPKYRAYGHAKELSSGKDTPSGHWEIAGVPVLFDWGYFTDHANSFPQELLDSIVKRANLPGYLGNCHASGTQVLDDLGEEHMKTGKPIFYTTADSVFQIACHE